MSESDWERFSALVDRFSSLAPTQARAQGLVISSLLNSVSATQPEPRPMDWMDWERRKTLRLLAQPEPRPTDWMDWERRKTLRLLLSKSS